MSLIEQDPFLSQVPPRFLSKVTNYSSKKFRDVGVVVKGHIRDRETLFTNLLGFARRNGLSIADPICGLLLVTPVNEQLRGQTWLRLRKVEVLEWLFRSGAGCHHIFHLFTHDTESFFVGSNQTRNGRPESPAAIHFREKVKEALLPDETLELHWGRVSILGPEESYRIHLNWEGCGRNAEFTADFRDPACLIVRHKRIPARVMWRRGLVGGIDPSAPIGMFDPRIVALIPDPVDRYASLCLFNHKLTERVPREIVEELRRRIPQVD